MKEKKEDLKCKVCGKDSEYWDNGYYCKKCFLKRNDHLMKHNNRTRTVAIRRRKIKETK